MNGGKQMSKGYAVVSAWDKNYLKDRLIYCMDAADLTNLEQEIEIEFGDKVYVIKDKTMYIRGNDNKWYEM